MRPETLPVHGAREGVASSWLRLVRSRPAHTASGADTPPACAVGYLTLPAALAPDYSQYSNDVN
jgi:hypothetical protein